MVNCQKYQIMRKYATICQYYCEWNQIYVIEGNMQENATNYEILNVYYDPACSCQAYNLGIEMCCN